MSTEHWAGHDLGNELINGEKVSGSDEVMVSERLGGLLKHYDGSAAWLQSRFGLAIYPRSFMSALLAVVRRR